MADFVVYCCDSYKSHLDSGERQVSPNPSYPRKAKKESGLKKETGDELHVLHMLWSSLPIRALLTRKSATQGNLIGNTRNPAKVMSGVYNSKDMSSSSISRNHDIGPPNLQNWPSTKVRLYTLEPESQDGLIYLESTGASMKHVGGDL